MNTWYLLLIGQLPLTGRSGTMPCPMPLDKPFPFGFVDSGTAAQRREYGCPFIPFALPPLLQH